MQTLGVIPARYDSTRLPGKPLADICGKTLIRRVYERAASSRLLDELLVATDDARIVAEVESFGGRAVMTSPTHTTGFDRVAEVAAQYDCQYVVCIHGDEPMLMSETIDEVASALIRDKNQIMAVASFEITNDTERIHSRSAVKVVSDVNENALLFSRSPIPYPQNAQYYRVFEAIGVFAFTKDFLMRYVKLPNTPLALTEAIEELKVTENGYPLKVIKTRFPYTPPSVNTPEELEAARRIIAAASL